MKKYFYIIIPTIIIAVAISAKFLFSNFSNSSSDAEAAATKTGLVGHWTMDSGDVSGTKMYDKSGQNNHGTMTGTSAIAGKIKQARSFNGSSDYIFVTDAASLKPATAVTVSAWVKLGSLTSQTTCGLASAGGQYILVKSNGRTGQNEGYVLWVDADLAWYFIVANSSGTQDFAFSTSIPVVGKWTHVVGVFDKPNVKIYINGVNEGNDTHNYDLAYGTRPVFIGRSGECGGVGEDANYDSYFTGAIEDTRIYNRALSAQEVAQLYSATGIARENTPQKASSTVSASNRLIGYWTMDAGDNSGGKMLDRSGMNTPGTMIGTTTSTGRIKESRTFNGTTNYISLFTSGATTSTLSPPQQVTISAWIKLGATGSWSWIASNASLSRNVTGGYGLLRTSGGIYAFNVNVWSQQASTGVTAVVDGKWHHLVGTYNGTTMTAYFDGVAGTPVAYSSPITYYADEIFYIGGSTVGGFTYPWNGQIDDVRVYNYGLSAQEVSNLYNSAKTTHANVATKTGLVGYWTMNNEDRSRNLIYDKSGFNNNGTLVGTTTSTGRVKEARNFNGTTDYLDMGDKSVYSISNSGFTVSGWFKVDVMPPAAKAMRMWLLEKGNTGTNEWAISINSWDNYYGKLVFCHWNAAGTLRTCRESSSMMVAGVWTHFTFTLTDTGAVPDVYINGALNNGLFEDWGNTVVDSTSQLLIGVCAGYAEGEFDGLIDEVRIYNRVLSAQEIANIYSAAKTTFIE